MLVHRARRAVAWVVFLALTGSSAAVLSGVAEAAPTVVRVAGDFVEDERDEIFEYRPGNGSDIMYVGYTKDGGTVHNQNSYTLPVLHTYAPFAGDFDGDGKDELFFFGAGDGGDFIWDFTEITSKREVPKTQGGLYLPVVADFNGNGIDDILWYAPGAAPDEIWEFLPDLTHRTHAIRNFTGDYVPLAGNFTGDGGEDVIFYGRGETADHLVDFEPGSFTPAVGSFGPLTGSDHRPFTLDAYGDGWTDIVFYNAGAPVDPVWNFTPERIWKHNEQALGTYTPVSGDFFGDGYEDIFWFGNTSSSIWDWEGGEHPVPRSFGTS